MKSLSMETRWKLFLASFGIAPFYVAPFVVLTLLSETSFSPFLVGIFPSALMSGQLLAVTLLPFVAKGRNIRTIGQIAFGLSILTLAFISIIGVTIEWLVALGASLGISSGVLFYFGTTVSLDAEEKFVAFLTRLAYSLLWAGAIVSFFALLFPTAGLTVLFVSLIAIYAFLFLVIPSWQIAVPSDQRTDLERWRPSEVWPLVLVFGFFVGQTGFYSFHAAIKFAEVSADVLQLSLPRIAAGVVLLVGTSLFLRFSGLKAVALLSIAEIVAILILFSSDNPVNIFLVICVYEIALNLVSSHLQASTGQLAPAMALRFLSPSVIGGAIAGPLVFGAMITHISSDVAIVFVLVTCGIPFLACVLTRMTSSFGNSSQGRQRSGS